MTDERPTPAAAARMSADLTGRDPSRTLAGLIDVLDRADGPPARRRVHPRHAAAARAAAHRSGPVPLRSVRPAPPTRPAPSAGPAPSARPAPAADPASHRLPASSPTPVGLPSGARPGALARLIRRVALWGAGPGGEYLAWSPSRSGAAETAFSSRVAHVATPVRRPIAAPRRGLLTGLRRRAALWGAGPCGEHRTWGAGPPIRPAVQSPPPAVTDFPVLLHALPDTPTIQPATPSPVAALVPGPAPSPAEPVATPAPSGHRPPAPPVAEEPAGSGVPVETARTPSPTGYPHRPQRCSSGPARSVSTASGLARARGDPSLCRARGSPRPPPCRALRAPG